jgi:phage-related holin
MKEPLLLINYLSQLTNPGWKWLVVMFTFLTAYIFPTVESITSAQAAMFLVGLDTITGIAAARARGEALQSAKFSRVLLKVFGYSVVWLTIALVFKNVGGFLSLYPYAINGTTTLIVVTEGLSVFENLKIMGVPLPEWLMKVLHSKEESMETSVEPPVEDNNNHK